jgi:hypothetical protein
MTEMNRKDRRSFLRQAKKHGIDPNKPDLSVVTAHYSSDYIQVITEQSSYIINLKDKLVKRVEGDDASHLHHDSEWYPYEDIYSCSVSFPLRMTWKDGDRLILRESTTIIAVNELDDKALQILIK